MGDRSKRLIRWARWINQQ